MRIAISALLCVALAGCSSHHAIMKTPGNGWVMDENGVIQNFTSAKACQDYVTENGPTKYGNAERWVCTPVGTGGGGAGLGLLIGGAIF